MSKLTKRLKKSIEELEGKVPKLSLWDRFVAWLKVPETYNNSTVVMTTVGRFSISIKAWVDWDKQMKKKYPVRYFLTDTLPDLWETFGRKTKDKIWWVRYRTINRNHVIKIRSLEPGWMDRDERMLHANFQILVDYVEIELARNEYKTPSVGKRDREKGLAHLDWEINDDACKRGPSPTQSEAAKEKKSLYLWWVDYRLGREDAWSHPAIWKDNDPEDDATSDECNAQAIYMEELHAAEDQRMLERLIAIRTTLWS
jgi:hypothetical protein